MSNKQFCKRLVCFVVAIVMKLLLTLAIFVLLPARSSHQKQVAQPHYQLNTNTDSESQGESQNVIDISYPAQIPFALASLQAMIPTDFEQFPDQFKKFYIKLLNNESWNGIARAQTNDYTRALVQIYNWYVTKLEIPSYLQEFPVAARALLSSADDATTANLTRQFRKINGIPAPPSKLENSTFRYHVPQVQYILDPRFATASASTFPQLESFDYKMVAIDTTKLSSTIPFVELEYTYNDSAKYLLFINNKDNLLSKASRSIEQLLENGNILIRHANKKHVPTEAPELLEALNISIAQNGPKLELYTSLKQSRDFARLKVVRLPREWVKVVAIGLLDSPLMPRHLPEVITTGASYRLVPPEAVFRFFGYSEKSDYTTTTSPVGGKKNFGIKFYMAASEELKVPVFYQNKRISGAASIILKTASDGQLSTTTPSLKIPSDDYRSGVAPIRITHRQATTNEKIWVEVQIITDDNVIVGSKDFRSTPRRPLPGEFDLKLYNANQRQIVFETPLAFTGPPKELAINYTKIFDSANEAAKLIGQVYYSAWGTYEIPKFQMPASHALRPVPNVIEPVFQNHQLSYAPPVTRRFPVSQRPQSKVVVQSNFGKLIEDLNKYANGLAQTAKAITTHNLFAGYDRDFLKPTMRKQEQKFVTENLFHRNRNEAVKSAFAEVKLATEILVNGPYVLKEHSGSVPPDISSVKRQDRASWLAFALPRIETIVQNRYQSLLSHFEEAMLNYKYTAVINQLLEATSRDYNGGFTGISQGLVEKKVMPIGPKTQEMQILTTKKQKAIPLTAFQPQLSTILVALKQHPVIEQIAGPKEARAFAQQSAILRAPQAVRDGKKRLVLEMTTTLFKIIDYFAKSQSPSLLSLLKINTHIADDKARLAAIVAIFNDAVTNFLAEKKVPLVAYALKVVINNRQLTTAIHNVKKTFDSFLAKPTLKPAARAEIRKFQDYDYRANPNKLAELAVKIGEYDLPRFFNDITKDNVQQTADKILRLDPFRELPSSLPPQSQFIDVIKHTSSQISIVFLVIGTFLVVTSGFVIMISYRNRRVLTFGSKLLIVVGLLGLATLIITIGFVIPAAALPLTV